MPSYQQRIFDPTKILTSDEFARLIVSDYVTGRIRAIRELKRELHAKQVLIDAEPEAQEPVNAELRGDAERLKKRVAELKRQLPAVCWQATFDESLSKSGRPGTWRKQSACRLNGLYMIDIDYMAEPAEWFRRQYEEGAVRLSKQAFCDALGVLLVHVTPSGEGLRMVAVADASRGNLSDNQHWLAQRLGVEVDEACKDATRLSFCPGFEDILFINKEKLFTYENPEFDKMYGPQYRGGSSVPTRAGGQNSVRVSGVPVDAAPHGGRPGDQASGAAAAAAPEADEESAALVRLIGEGYYGISYEKIIDSWFKCCNKGKVPAPGERHRVLLKLAFDLRYICDNKAAFLVRAMCQHPMVKAYAEEEPQDLAAIADSACGAKMWFNIPKRFQSVLDAAGVHQPEGAAGDAAEGGAQLDYDGYAQRLLPLLADAPGLREAVAPLDDRLKMGGVLAALSMLGTYLTRTWWEHFDGRYYRLSFLTYIIGQSASGKSFLTELDKLIMAPMKSADKVGRAAEQQYKEEQRRRKANEKLCERPHAVVRYCPSSTSNNVFYHRLEDAIDPTVLDPDTGEPLHMHLITVESELATALRSQRDSWAGKTDLELKAFQNENAGVDYSNNDSVNGIMQVNWNQVISGTKVSMAHKIKPTNVLDGLVTRLALFVMPQNDYQMIERRRYRHDPDRSALLRQLGYKLELVKGELKVPRLVDFCYDYEEQLTKRADLNDDRMMDYFRKRIPVLMMRFALVRLVLRQLDDAIEGRELKVEDSDLEFAELMGDWCLDAQLHMFGQMVEDALVKESLVFVVKKPNVKNQQIYNSLPEEFTADEAIEQGLGKDVRACHRLLKRWGEHGYIEQIEGTNKYRRVFKKF